MRKRILIGLSIATILISCTGVSSVSQYNVKEISAIATKTVQERDDEFIGYRDSRIMKKGYGKWYVNLYGLDNYFVLEIGEDGKILKYEKKDYIE